VSSCQKAKIQAPKALVESPNEASIAVLDGPRANRGTRDSQSLSSKAPALWPTETSSSMPSLLHMNLRPSWCTFFAVKMVMISEQNMEDFFVFEQLLRRIWTSTSLFLIEVSIKFY
jgi:hypothetical protein